MENIGHPLPLHEQYRHTKGKVILNIRFGTYEFTWNGTKIPHIGRCGGLILHHFGFKDLDAQVVFPLSTTEG